MSSSFTCCSSLFSVCANFISNLLPKSPPEVPQVHVVDTPLDYVLVCVEDEERKECERFVAKLESELHFERLMRQGACIACSALGKCEHRQFMDGPPVYPNLDKSTPSLSTISLSTDDEDNDEVNETYYLDNNNFSHNIKEGNNNNDDEYYFVTQESLTKLTNNEDAYQDDSYYSLLREIDNIQRTLQSHKNDSNMNDKEASDDDSAIVGWDRLISGLNDLLLEEDKDHQTDDKTLPDVIEEALETYHSESLINSAIETTETNYYSSLGSGLWDRGFLPREEMTTRGICSLNAVSALGVIHRWSLQGLNCS